jgi:hypothetical protein
MVDGRDLAVVEKAFGSSTAAAAAFADAEMKVLKGKVGDIEITVLFEEGGYEWSNPGVGGVFPVRPVRSLFHGVRTDHAVEFCGYIARDYELVTMDGARNVLDHYILDDIQLFQQHP